MQVPQKEAAATAPSFLFSGKTNLRTRNAEHNPRPGIGEVTGS